MEMDPALLAAYEQAYQEAVASRDARRAARNIISATASAARAAVTPTSTPSELRRMAESNNFGIGTLARGLLLLLWYLFAFLLRQIWSWLIRPVLLVLLVAAGILLLINLPRLAHWGGLHLHGENLRDRYDDFALNNGFLRDMERRWASFKRDMEQKWASFKRAMTDLELMLRYNWYMDQLRLLRQEIRLFYDRVMGNLHWILLAMILTSMFVNRTKNAVTPQEVEGWPGFENLPPKLQELARPWQQMPRKGSNSHYRPEPEQQKVVPWDEWVRGVGNDESVSIEPVSETVTITQTERTTTEAESNLDIQETETSSTHIHSGTQTSSTSEAAEDHRRTASRAVHGEELIWCKECQQFHLNVAEVSSTTHTHSATQSSASEPAENYWAPTETRRVFHGEESMWCRECQQFHCCELPY